MAFQIQTGISINGSALEATGTSENIDLTLTPKGLAGIILSSGVPGVTTNKLYNNSGVLNWNGNKFTFPQKTISISPSGGDYSTIQAALNANTSGGELFLVYPGTYSSDTITFTANNQSIVGIGDKSQQSVTQVSSTIIDFATYTNCRIENLYIEITGATSLVHTLTGSTGSIILLNSSLKLTNSSEAGNTQPACIQTSDTATVQFKNGDLIYVNDIDNSSSIKAVCRIASGSIVDLMNSNISANGSNSSTSHSLAFTIGS